ncbi:monoheme cytochrome C [Flagellimonas sp. S174]|uniref:monoheme cytochrome C n=1 Tax=Flagellimonas sp. S174 TaxID=3410790 RepID=UPI003BF49C5A
MSFENKFKTQVQKLYQRLILGFGIIVLSVFALIYIVLNPSSLQKTPNESEIVDITTEQQDLVENGIHVATGFIDANGLTEVIQNCTNCHSAKLVTQNRMTKEGWVATIRWMQETQNLWDLGKNEEIIVNYLATNYAPDKKGRRDILTDIDWYTLEE